MNNKKSFYPTKYFVYFTIFIIIISFDFLVEPNIVDLKEKLVFFAKAPKVKLWMSGQYNFITIFYFFDIQAPILKSIRNFSSNKIFFKISFKNGKSALVDKPKNNFHLQTKFFHRVCPLFSQSFVKGKYFNFKTSFSWQVSLSKLQSLEAMSFHRSSLNFSTNDYWF